MSNILAAGKYVKGKMSPITILSNENKVIKLLSFDKGFHLKPHKADNDVLILIVEGKGIATVFGKQNELNEMDYIVFPKNQIHEVLAVTKMKMLLIK